MRKLKKCLYSVTDAYTILVFEGCVTFCNDKRMHAWISFLYNINPSEIVNDCTWKYNCLKNRKCMKPGYHCAVTVHFHAKQYGNRKRNLYQIWTCWNFKVGLSSPKEESPSEMLEALKPSFFGIIYGPSNGFTFQSTESLSVNLTKTYAVCSRVIFLIGYIFSRR